MTINKQEFDLNCTKCERLVNFLHKVKKDYPNYHARPVPPFGVAKPALLIVGLAPGLHGANATGRPFTGDYAGIYCMKPCISMVLATNRPQIPPLTA